MRGLCRACAGLVRGLCGTCAEFCVLAVLIHGREIIRRHIASEGVREEGRRQKAGAWRPTDGPWALGCNSGAQREGPDQ